MTPAIETLAGLFLATERAHERTAVLSRRAERGWSEMPDWRFHRQVIRLALHMHERMGVKSGDRVLIAAPLSVEALVVDWAIVSQGAVAVVVEPEPNDELIAAVLAETSPRAAFVARPLLSSNIEESVQVVTFEEGGELSFAQALDLGGTLDTAERAGAFRSRARAVLPSTEALIHLSRRRDGSLEDVRVTHEQALEPWARRMRSAPPQNGDIAYVRPDARSLRAHLVLYGLVGDGLTRTVIGSSAVAAEAEIHELGPRWVVARHGVEERRPRAPARARRGLVRRWIERTISGV